jgi:hypothetical protein
LEALKKFDELIIMKKDYYGDKADSVRKTPTSDLNSLSNTGFEILK